MLIIFKPLIDLIAFAVAQAIVKVVVKEIKKKKDVEANSKNS